MGEAGPEAILPLSRGADGKLEGVKGGSGDVGLSVSRSTLRKGTAKTSANGDTTGAWTQFAGRIKTMITEQMVVEKRPGGLLYQ